MIVKMKLSQYMRQAFAEGSTPDARTLRRRIDRQELPGCTEGGGEKPRYYVYIDSGTKLPAWPPGLHPEGVAPVNSVAADAMAQIIGKAAAG